jgi:multiple RNA-binding domain-containing protein 1
MVILFFSIDTKKYLEEAGVCLNSFIKRKVRSKTLILVKNLPSKTVEEDITTLFEKFGELGRVVFPPSRTIALVEFTEPNEAKAAFKKLAFSKFKNSVLYLEWAPIGTFTTEYNKEEAEKIKIAKNNVELVVNKAEPETKKINLLEIDENEPVSTVFVKNLNFETTDSTLKSTFESLSGLRSARISRKMDAKSKTKLSMGFGFLEFTTKEEAMTCIKTMQNFKLDNHELVLKFSNSTQNESKSRKRVEEDIIITGTKLIVRNLPFEATKKDLQQLFTYFYINFRSFGQVKSVRLPSKFDGKHRGFGFVDFLTVNEAKSAFESLGATHLYGRHLVIEWAQDENSIDAMREKTQKNFVKSSNKKQRVEMGDEDDHFLQD